jgi:predicted NBD/HSP70 family sugar kinase
VDALCLGLPCALDDALAPGACTYGWESRASLVSDILAASGLNPPRATVRVLNDAELTAEAARRDGRVTGARVLCLTLGFGPGGALLERGSS